MREARRHVKEGTCVCGGACGRQGGKGKAREVVWEGVASGRVCTVLCGGGRVNAKGKVKAHGRWRAVQAGKARV